MFAKKKAPIKKNMIKLNTMLTSMTIPNTFHGLVSCNSDMIFRNDTKSHMPIMSISKANANPRAGDVNMSANEVPCSITIKGNAYT